MENNFDNKDLKKFKRENYKIRKLNEFTYSLIRPYLENSKTYLDYGCGKMALIRRIVKENHTNFINIYGFDPKVKIEYLPQDDRVEFFNQTNKLKNIQKLDLISVNFVLHHLSQEEIIHTLSLLKSKLSKNGKILILEESFPENSPKGLHNQINKLFLDLNNEEKINAIFLNDVLINYKNLDYMPWTMQYKSMEEWKIVFINCGLNILESEFIGISDLPRIKQGITSKFILM